MRKALHSQALFLCPLLLSGLVVAVPASAQSGQTEWPQQPTTDLGFVMESPTNAGFNFDAQSRVVHDDNIFNNNADRRGGFVFQESAFLNLWDKHPTWNIGVQYQPTALLYSSASSLNAIDQQAKAQGEYQLTQRLRFAWNEVAEDRTSLLSAASNQYFTLPIGPPPTLNSTVETPLAREISSQSQVHALYDTSPRSSWDLMGSYDVMVFSGIGGNSPDLLNTTGAAGGLGYSYRITARFTLGARYLFESYHYGSASLDEVHSAYLTALWNLGPHFELSLFGGPQYSVASGALPSFAAGQFVGEPIWAPAGGASITYRSDRTAVQLAGQRIITSGGGLLGTVTSAYEGAEFRRRLTGDWDLVLTGGYAQTSQIQSGPETGAIGTQTAGFAVEHPIFSNLNLHAGYDFLRQRVNEFVPLGTNVNRNQYTVSVFYAFGEHRL